MMLYMCTMLYVFAGVQAVIVVSEHAGQFDQIIELCNRYTNFIYILTAHVFIVCN